MLLFKNIPVYLPENLMNIADIPLRWGCNCGFLRESSVNTRVKLSLIPPMNGTFQPWLWFDGRADRNSVPPAWDSCKHLNHHHHNQLQRNFRMWGCLFGDFPHPPTNCFMQFPFPPLFSHIFILILYFWLHFQTKLWLGGGVAFGRGVGGV